MSDEYDKKKCKTKRKALLVAKKSETELEK